MAIENEVLAKVDPPEIKFMEEHSQEEILLEPLFEKQLASNNNVPISKKDPKNCPGSPEDTSLEVKFSVDEEPEGEDVPDSNISQKTSNTYAAKKTVAQGMMDIALITANANQLRFIIEFNQNSSTYYLNLGLIIISLFLQIGVGVSLIFKGRMDLRGESKHKNAKRINNYVVVGIFLVTIINVFIASFTITGGHDKK